MDADEDALSWEPATPTHRGRCGKVRYGSQSSAKAAMRVLQRNGKQRSYEGRLHPYACRECHGWHVGHTYRGDR